MALRQVITLDISQQQRAYRQAKQEAKSYSDTSRKTATGAHKAVGDSATRMGATVEKVSARMKAVMVGAFLAISFAAKRAIGSVLGDIKNTQSAMVQSTAIMQDVTQSSFREMERAARRLSPELNLPAEELAKAYFFLASAGLNVEQSLAALPGVARFAKAGMFDLATATDLSTDALSALGLKVADPQKNLENLVRVTDVLAKANNLANASIQQFSEAITNRAGASLKIVGKDIEEGVAVLAAFADQGVKGAEAGTALGIVMRDLQTQAFRNKKAFAEAKVTVFDATGTMSNMADIVGQLEQRLSGMSDEQKKAELMTLGFNDRSVIFLQTLLGTSSAIRDYERDLRTAAGTVEELAKKQMEAINEKMGSFWQRLKNIAAERFGEKVLDVINSKLERMNKLLNLTQSPEQNLLSALEGLEGVDPALKAELELQIRRMDLRAEQDRIQRDLDELDLNVRVGLEKKSFQEMVVEDIKGIYDILGADLSVFIEQSRFRSTSKREDPSKIPLSSLMQEVDEMQKALMGLAKVDLSKMTDEQRDALQTYIAALREEIANGTEAIALRIDAKRVNEQLALSYKAVKEAKGGTPDPEDPPDGLGDGQLRMAEKAQEILDKLIRAQQLRSQLSDEERQSLQRVLDARDEILTLEELSKTLGKEKLKDQMAAAQTELRSAELALGKAKEVREAYRDAAESLEGLIGKGVQGQLGAAGILGLKPSETKIIEDGLISESALRKVGMTSDAAAELARHLNDSGDAAKETRESLDGLASGIRIMTRLADTFGDLSDEARRMADGIADVLTSIAKIDTGFLSGVGGAVSSAIPYIGAAVGIASAVSSLVGALKSDSEARRREAKEALEAMKKLRDALRQNARDIRRAVDAMLNESRRGLGASGAQAEALSLEMQAFQQAMEEAERIREFPGGEGQAEALIKSAFQTFLSRIADLNIPGLDLSDFRERFQEGMAAGQDPFFVIRQILEDLGLQDILEDVLNVGELGQNVNGAIDALGIFRDLLGQDIPEAFENFLSFLLDNVEGLSGDMASLLEEARGLAADGDLSQEDRQRLEAIARIILERVLSGDAAFLGELTEEEANRIAEALLGISQDSTGSDPFTRSVQIARSITEIQANEIVVILDEMLLVMKNLLAVTRANSPLGVVPGLPRGLTTTIDTLTSRPFTPVPMSGQNGISVDGWTVNVNGKLDESTIQQVGRVVMDELRRRSSDPGTLTGTFRRI